MRIDLAKGKWTKEHKYLATTYSYLVVLLFILYFLDFNVFVY